MRAADAVDLALELARGRTTAVELVERSLAAVEEAEPALGALAELDRAGALERAQECDRRRARGEARGPLDGLPFVYKSNLCRAGHPTSAGSRILRGWTPTYDATALRRMVAAGAIPLGSTRMDELGMGSTGETCAEGPTRNPWHPERVPGGSSSGSAAAVAAGLVPLALGSDTGGSVRQPAAHCGLAGLRPTWGRVSRYGLVAFASSLDQVGPLAHSARDLELVLAAISGADPRDARCLPIGPFDPARLDEPGLAGLRIGVVEAWLEAADPSVGELVRAAVGTLSELGARVRTVALPHDEHALAVYHVVSSAEAGANLARLDGLRYGTRAPASRAPRGLDETLTASRTAGLGAEVRRRLCLGAYAASAGARDDWLLQAARVRRLLAGDFARAFSEVDLLVGPTAPAPARRLGEPASDPLERYGEDRFTVAASLAGLPAASVPCGLVPVEDGARLPAGLQMIGPALADAAVLRVARAYQAATRWHLARPPRSFEGPAS